jgi:hypothetical protein
MMLSGSGSEVVAVLSPAVASAPVLDGRSTSVLLSAAMLSSCVVLVLVLVQVRVLVLDVLSDA